MSSHLHASADASSPLENLCLFLPPALQEATPMQLFHRDAPGDLSSVGTSPPAWPLERPPQPAAPLAQVWRWISQLGRDLHPHLPVPAASSRVPGRLQGWQMFVPCDVDTQTPFFHLQLCPLCPLLDLYLPPCLLLGGEWNVGPALISVSLLSCPSFHL